MAAGIQEHDLGYIWGDTWHKDPRFRTLDRPVTISEVMEVFNWDMELMALHFNDPRPGVRRVSYPVQAYAVLRKDTRHILAHHVGQNYVAESNREMANFINESLLAAFPDLQIEGAGTLWNNKVAFINLRAKEFQVKGDKSPTYNRMMFYNPIGIGAYKACAHNVRVVCNNTLKAAEAEGAANNTLRKFAHVNGAIQRIDEYCQQMAKVLMGLEEQKLSLDLLASQPMTTEVEHLVLGELFPITKDTSPIMADRYSKNRQKIMEVFHQVSAEEMTGAAQGSKYAFLNAVTWLVDHEESRMEPVNLMWDRLTGKRMDLKSKAFNLLAA